MLTDAFLAARNIARQRRRSAFALAAIAFGVAALIVANGFIDWIMFKHRETTITSQYGHIQVTRKGYFEEGTADPFGYLLPKSSPVQNTIERLPELRVLGRRLAFSGLVSKGDETISFIAEGVEPDKEQVLSSSLRIPKGANLSANDPNGIILGLGLAANLGIDIGDTVVLMANTATGSINAVECRVRGFFATMSKAYDDVALRVPLATAQKLLKVDGAHTWALLLAETEQAGLTLRTLRQRFANENLVFTEWIELADFHVKAVSLLAKQAGVMRVIIAVIIVLSIFNTMMMSVMERTGEIGTIMALGLTRRDLLRMIVVEGAVLGIVGGLLGLALGTLLAWVISYIGIPMPPPPGQSWGFMGEVMVTGRLAVEAFLLAVGSTLIASIIPARTASGMVIVDALRFNR
ncbi:MAG: ABC transporter permease [Candidatus Accumulibacter sp.]|uniref:ABC transporter permease n=1 Tax=Candidatus Accumulibacter cognatus TaxID=2954383 RepID=A0A080MGT2_9PROT|nr:MULTISPECIES: FtsX-like permease family protein [Candidatus Accumulibacter]KFB76469.1 MAG: Lipoprotein-releasing system transmembrane protein LolE [Candidatus Accumulibacter cognatus]MBN8519538.1 ABC transporter permease [Accumulibacter sp.]MBO3710373.1 ABC transporter permease [Accumulibacter sp.]QLH48494.1 MAG: ABC transporter permease [Candidatus Accumulibacter cognatus]HMW54143.1 FtsX-like permease family protein [Accumulibacter sp.]